MTDPVEYLIQRYQALVNQSFLRTLTPEEAEEMERLGQEIGTHHAFFYEPIIETLEFLKEHSFLQPVIKEALQHARRIFPATASLYLRTVTDPEGDESDTELVLFIQLDSSTISPGEAFALMQRLDKEWWLDAMDRAQDKFHVTVEFR